MNLQENPRIFDQAKRGGIEFRLPEAYARALWPKVTESFGHHQALGKLLHDLSIAPHASIRKESLALHGFVQLRPIVTIDLFIMTSFNYENAEKHAFQLAGKIHFSGKDHAMGIRRIIAKKGILVDLLTRKGVAVKTTRPEGFAWAANIYDREQLLFSFIPLTTKSERTRGGMAALAAPVRTGTVEQLTYGFSQEVPKYLRGLAYITDGLVELEGYKPPNKRIHFRYNE